MIYDRFDALYEGPAVSFIRRNIHIVKLYLPLTVFSFYLETVENRLCYFKKSDKKNISSANTQQFYFNYLFFQKRPPHEGEKCLRTAKFEVRKEIKCSLNESAAEILSENE